MFGRKKIILVVAIWFAVGVGLSSCVCHVRPPRPAPRVEVKPPRPAAPRAKWVPGHWRWNRRGKKWHWVPGHWK